MVGAFTWTTKDGRQLGLGDITDKHLGNILRFLLQKHEERSPLSPASPAFQTLSKEVRSRRLKWKVQGSLCDFPIEDDDGLPQECCLPAVMWTAEDGVRKTSRAQQHPRCEQHRDDRHSFLKEVCDGCFRQASPELRFVLQVGREDGLLFCSDCTKESDGPAWSFVTLLLLILTLGLWRRQQ